MESHEMHNMHNMHKLHNMHMNGHNESFSTEISGLVPASAPEIVDLADGATFNLVAAPVRKQIGDKHRELHDLLDSVIGEE